MWKQGIDDYSPKPPSLYWINTDIIPGIWTLCLLHHLHYPAGLRWVCTTQMIFKQPVYVFIGQEEKSIVWSRESIKWAFISWEKICAKQWGEKSIGAYHWVWKSGTKRPLSADTFFEPIDVSLIEHRRETAGTNNNDEMFEKSSLD